MNRNEVLALGRWVQAACPQQKWDKHTPDVWTEILGDYPADDAMAAVKQLVQRQPFISLSDLIGEIKLIRRARFKDVNPEQLGAGVPADDVAGFLEKVKSDVKAIGDGVPADVVVDGRSYPVGAVVAGLARQKAIGPTRQEATA